MANTRLTMDTSRPQAQDTTARTYTHVMDKADIDTEVMATLERKREIVNELAARYEPTALERVARMWWVFWYTARPIVLGAIGSILPVLVTYLIIGWNVVDEMEHSGVEFRDMDSYTYTLVSWPRALSVVQTVCDDHAQTLKDIQRTLEEINSGRWERKPANQDSTRPAARPKGGL